MGLCRLYVPQDLKEGGAVHLVDEAFHYLIHVMRLTLGQQVRLFNGRHGDWLGILEKLSKKEAVLRLETRLKPQVFRKYLGLFVPPLRPSRMAVLLEKVTELGLTDLYPLQTDHGAHGLGRPDKILKQMIEACEQSERLCIPTLHPIRSLKSTLDTLTYPLLWAYERSDNQENSWSKNGKQLLIGPEGGFSKAEIDALRSHDQVIEISLGSQILRAETAAIVGIFTLGRF